MTEDRTEDTSISIETIAARALAEAAFHRSEATKLQELVHRQFARIRALEAELKDHKDGHDSIVQQMQSEIDRHRAAVRAAGLEELS